MNGASSDPLRALERERVTRLKQQILRRTYRVDPEAVAQEILFKLRMVNLGRRGLLTDAPETGPATGPSGK